jgi:hypothetical protein
MDHVHRGSLVWNHWIRDRVGELSATPILLTPQYTKHVLQGGGQDSLELEAGDARATQIESTFKLKTDDEPPALYVWPVLLGTVFLLTNVWRSIECKSRGYRTGPAETMQILQDPAREGTVDPRTYRYRTLLTMKTSDERYAEKVNFEMWVGTCLRRGSEVIYE